MGTVFYLPGILGSGLDYAAPPNARYWPDRKALALNLCRDLLLDGSAGGFVPAGVNGLRGAEPLQTHYGRAVDGLRADLLGTAFQRVVPWGYDWRQSMLVTAAILSNTIEADAVPSNPCVLVGHSMGGLIARLAYGLLNRAGKANLVKRVILLGTPNRGSARVIAALNGDFGEGYGYVFKASVLDGLVAPFRSAAGAAINTIMGSWPGFIEMLPMIEADNSDDDKIRQAAFLPASYRGGGVLFPTLFTHARDVAHPALRDATTIPAGKRLVSIVGTGYPTPTVDAEAVPDSPQPFFADFIGSPLTLTKNGAGDGTVTERSAYVSGSQLVTVECSHNALPEYTFRSGLLSQLITETIDPDALAPPPPARPPQEVAPSYVGPPLQPPPPPEPPPPKIKRGVTGRGRPIRR